MAKLTSPAVIEHMLAVYKDWQIGRDGMPKKSRYVLGDKIDGRFVHVLELLYIASYQSPAEKLPTLQDAALGLDTLKFFLRVAWEIQALDTKRYGTLSEALDRVGREVGGWLKGIQIKTAGQ